MEQQNKKKLIIIGAGISGLSAGIYSARAGFDVHILEQHSTFGGFQTGWSRKGYFFEGGMHWLTGSSEKTPLNRIWKETGALQENNPIENRDPYYTLIDGDKKLNLYRDVKKLKQEFLKFAPEDKVMINRLCKDISYFKAVHLPLNDVFGLKTKNPTHPSIMELLAMAPAGLRYFYLINTSYKKYVSKFKNANIRHLLMSVIGDRYNALAFIYTMASFASGDSGFPAGGSIRFVGNMLETFKSLGGTVSFNKRIQRVLTKDGLVTGVQLAEEVIPCDAVIVSSDTRVAIDNFFDKPLIGDWTDKFRENLDGSQNMFVSMGVNMDLSHLPHSMVFPFDEPLSFADSSFSEIRVNNYSTDSEFSPKGKTSLTCVLLSACYDFWKKAKENGTYKEKKEEFAKIFIDRLSKFIPEIKEKLEVIDIATPVTYERYCSSYKGSWMTVWKKGKAKPRIPQKYKEIKNLYFAGQRIFMCGGLPIAVYSGRRAVQLLCKDLGIIFV